MLSFGVLFFSLVAIMVPRAPQAVVGGDKDALEEGRRSLSPGGTRCPGPAGEGRAKIRQDLPGKLRLGGEGCPRGLPARTAALPNNPAAGHPPHPRWGVGRGPVEGGAGLL